MLYEITDEEGIVHSYKLRTRPIPIIKKREFRRGDKAPRFVLQPGDVRWAEEPLATGRWLHSQELLRKPLIISFFCEGWGSYGTRMLDQLQALNSYAQPAGAQLLVLTQTPASELDRLADTYNITYNLGFDKGNRIACLLGAYDAAYPAWDRIAGINEDVLTPGIFVIDSQEKFLHAQLDKDFEMAWNEDTLARALPNLAQSVHYA
jgi:peroxiredoxin